MSETPLLRSLVLVAWILAAIGIVVEGFVLWLGAIFLAASVGIITVAVHRFLILL